MLLSPSPLGRGVGVRAGSGSTPINVPTLIRRFAPPSPGGRRERTARGGQPCKERPAKRQNSERPREFLRFFPVAKNQRLGLGFDARRLRFFHNVDDDTMMR